MVDLNAKSKPATATKAAPAKTPNSTLLMIGGAVLALLILGGIAAAIARRRRVREEEWVYDEPSAEAPAQAMEEERYEPMAEEPVHRSTLDEEQPPVVAPAASAFSFGSPEAATTEEPMVEDERRPGESWIERAYRGPSPSNPSVSLKARLKRAAFFDKRQREAAAGTAQPIETSAGLPGALVDEQENELA